jgi:CHAT domain-containing protein
VGLARSLQVAGARGVVASQWQVADQSTGALMVAFHRELRKGVVKDEALRRAMVQVQRCWKHPYHWAAFLLMGDPGNLHLER